MRLARRHLVRKCSLSEGSVGREVEGEAHLLGGGDDALGDDVALHDAAEDVDLVRVSF